MAAEFEPDEELSQLITSLWNADANCCHAGYDYELDLQGYVTSTRNLTRDRANMHLFSWVDEEKVFERETYKAFRALLDNYEHELGKQEQVTEDEIKENNHFIDVIMETDVMQILHNYLVTNEKAPEDVDEFKRELYNIWFKLYRRTKGDRDFDSCGFEHVFVGESRDHQILGFHNWIQFYLQEKKGNIDYRGYFRRGTSNEDQPKLVTCQFLWKDEKEKPIGSSFIGTSPEFELAVYTLLVMMDRFGGVNVLIAEEYEVEVKVYPLGKGIGTAYPVSKCD